MEPSYNTLIVEETIDHLEKLKAKFREKKMAHCTWCNANYHMMHLEDDHCPLCYSFDIQLAVDVQLKLIP